MNIQQTFFFLFLFLSTSIKELLISYIQTLHWALWTPFYIAFLFCNTLFIDLNKQDLVDTIYIKLSLKLYIKNNKFLLRNTSNNNQIHQIYPTTLYSNHKYLLSNNVFHHSLFFSHWQCLLPRKDKRRWRPWFPITFSDAWTMLTIFPSRILSRPLIVWIDIELNNDSSTSSQSISTPILNETGPLMPTTKHG